MEKIKETGKVVVEISTKNRIGLENLYEEIEKIIETSEISSDNENIVTNTRHKSLIIKGKIALEQALETMANDMPIDVIVVYIKEILENLGEITGETVTEDIIKEIFSKFCLGK